jgi:hypothetical protein
MPGLEPGIHVFLFRGQDVDGRDKPGQDENRNTRIFSAAMLPQK